MIPEHKSFKLIALLLSVIILFQSCSIYHRTPSTLETVTEVKAPVKIISDSNEIYKFEDIYYEDNELIGFSSDRKTVIALSKNASPKVNDGFYSKKVGIYKIQLSELDIAEIYMVDKKAADLAKVGSRVGAIAGMVILSMAILGLLLYIGFNDM